jgi:sigma-B regulation protein RsbU (phosphoserine phosphatase)
MGGMPDYKYKKESLSLNKGDYFFLYTDGVTEAMDAQNNQYSEKRLDKVLSDIEELNVNMLLKTVSKDIEDFVQENPASDDITMLAFKYNGS